MDEKIEKVIYTLNKIDVRGSENLSMMLGCIQALNEIKQNLTERAVEQAKE